MNYSYAPLNQLESNAGSSTANSSSMIRDWRKQLRTPPTYRIGNRTFRVHFHIALSVVCVVALIIIFFTLQPASTSSYSNKQKWFSKYETPTAKVQSAYNYTYPLTAPLTSNGIQTFRIGLIADMDKESKDKQKPNTWRSFLKKGFLSYSPSKNSVVVTFSDSDKTTEICAGYALNGRGMELSELVTFNGRILTFDDRTGLVYQLQDDKVIPWVLLMDGAGNTGKGFKSEWATVKDEVLFVGSMGKEWTTSAGEFESHDPMFVKAVTMSGEVKNDFELLFCQNSLKLNILLLSKGSPFKLGGKLQSYPSCTWHRLAGLYDSRIGSLVTNPSQMVLFAETLLARTIQ